MSPEVFADITKGVPAAFSAAIMAYAESRRAPNMFIRALIGNQLDDCCAYMPIGVTVAELRACVRMVFNAIPGRARGSYQNVDSWLNGTTQLTEATEASSGTRT